MTGNRIMPIRQNKKIMMTALCSLAATLTASELPAGLAGAPADISAMENEVLKKQNIALEKISQGIVPADYSKYAVIYLGESYRNAQESSHWTFNDNLKLVHQYVESGGTVILSGSIVHALGGGSGRNLRNLEKIGEITGFARTVDFKAENCSGFKFTDEEFAKCMGADDPWVNGIVYPWQKGSTVAADRLNGAKVLGVFVVDGKELPALTVHYIGKGKVFWVAPLLARELDYYRKNNISMGDADEQGTYIFTPEGKAVEALRTLYGQLFLGVPNLAKNNTAVSSEKSQWALEPLGAKGNLTYSGKFPNTPKFKNAEKALPGLPLNRNGQRAVIVLPEKATKMMKQLAGELKYHLEKMTGDAFIIKDHALPEETALIIGNEEHALKFGCDLKKMPAQVSIIARQGNHLLIAGNGPGQSYALTYLLESLGIRYLWPGGSGKIIPKLKEPVLPEISLNYVPEFEVRGIRFPNFSNERTITSFNRCGIDPVSYSKHFSQAVLDQPDNRGFYQWHGVNDMGSETGYRDDHRAAYTWGHSMGDLYDKYKKSNPEFFALQPDGTRIQKSSERANFCDSNREMAKAIARDRIEKFKKDPWKKGLSICLNDGGYQSRCMCVECRKLDPVNAPAISMLLFSPTRKSVNYVAFTDRVLTFSNRIAEEVTAVCPDKKLTMYVYSSYRTPPVAVKPHPALVLFAVNGTYTDDKTHKHDMEAVAGWSTFGNQMFWRPNAMWGFVNAFVPQNYGRKIFHDVEVLKANGFIGTDFGTSDFSWALKGLPYYATVKALRNPERLDYDAYFKDYCAAGFGPAAIDIEQYFTLLEQLCNKAAADAKNLYEYFNPQVFNELQEYLDHGKRKAGGDSSLMERLNFLQVGLDYGKLNYALHMLGKSDPVKFAELQKELLNSIQKISRETPMAVCPGTTGFYGPLRGLK